MARLLSGFLMLCMLLTLIPQEALAQLLLNPAIDAQVRTSVSETGVAKATTSSGFGYIPQGNLPGNYKLGPGDQLEIHLIVEDNALALDYSFAVNPEGKIFFPNIGEINLSNLTLKQAKAKLIRVIKKKYYEKFTLSLMISAPKFIKIYVTGQVNEPGLYKVYDGARISEVIKEVGIGLGGSSRNVIIKREDHVIDVDLYEILYKGDVDSDISVRMGDVIEVPPMGAARVTVMGEVPRPGQYEIKEGERLKDALAMAGYVGVNSALSEVAYLRRKRGQEEFKHYKLNLYDMFFKDDDAYNMELTDGDIINVPSIKAYVYIYGEVGNGGRIDFIPGQKLSDYINLAGGPSVKANLAGVTVTRQENGKAKRYRINASDILHKGKKRNDLEIFAGDVIFVPGNFFYFSDFASFANTIILGVTLYQLAR